MKTIYKYPLEITDTQIITMFQGAEILTVQVQNGIPCLWALVDPTNDAVDKTISVIGTGREVGRKAVRYIGTFQFHAGELIFHVFEK